jgi:hypothetical protein
MPRYEFESGTFSWFYAVTFVRVKNRICLSCGVQVAGAAWIRMKMSSWYTSTLENMK